MRLKFGNSLLNKFSQFNKLLGQKQKPPVPSKNWEQLLNTYESANPFDDDDREYSLMK